MHRAVEELLVERSSQTLTIPLIAARAGVHPTTIYRRWESLADLLTAVASSRLSRDDMTDTGTLRGDLETWATTVAADLADPGRLSHVRAAICAADSDSARAAYRRAQLEAMIERARSRDVRVPSVEQAVDLVLGPLYYRAIFTDRPVTTDWALQLVDALLA